MSGLNEEPYTVLEIGSGSYKLHKNLVFSTRFESSLGKNLQGNSLHPDSVKVAVDTVRNQIIPFLKEHQINPLDVLVFATAAVRRSMSDTKKTGHNFLNVLDSFGFQNVKVFSEDEECDYAAWAVFEEIGDLHDCFQVLDTGGASHQLVEFDHGRISHKLSVPIGSHSDFGSLVLPDFVSYGFSEKLPLTVIGTTGKIINHVTNLNRNTLGQMLQTMETQSITARRDFLKLMVSEESIYPLFVDYRLKVLPNAFKIVYNCVESLLIDKFIYSSNQAINYISKYGFIARS